MSPPRPETNQFVSRLRALSGRETLMILSATPILLLFAVAPQTFELSWAGFGQLGRGGLFFSLFFLAFDLTAFKKASKIEWSFVRKIVTILTVGLAAVYFVEVGLGQALTEYIYSVGRGFGASGQVSNSFLMAMDYLAFTVYLTILTTELFSVRTIQRVATSVVFSAGMLIFYLLDAFFPYGSIGPLQFWANFIVGGVTMLAGLFRLPIYGLANTLTIIGLHGVYQLIVYWPSVGVQSILIYSLVMLVLAAKLNAPIYRKAIYSAVGIVGTICLNVTRIFAITLYGYLYATSGQQLNAFHNVIGEVLFPIWIMVYLVIVIRVEDRLAMPIREQVGNRRKIDTTRKVKLKPKKVGGKVPRKRLGSLS